MNTGRSVKQKRLLTVECDKSFRGTLKFLRLQKKSKFKLRKWLFFRVVDVRLISLCRSLVPSIPVEHFVHLLIRAHTKGAVINATVQPNYDHENGQMKKKNK